MTSPATQGLSLYEAARVAGVTFSTEAVPEDRFVEANDMRFHYLDWGNPDKPDMLLLHGFAQQCHSWDFVALAFTDKFHVRALDLRGHGDSDWAPDGDYSPEAQQNDIKGVVQEIGLKDFVLMGLSMGGRNSFTYASNHPDEVRALVIVDAGPENLQSGSQNIRQFVQQDDELDSIDAFVERVIAYNPRRDPVQLRGSLVHNLKQLPNGKWTWKYDRALRGPGRRMGHDARSALLLGWRRNRRRQSQGLDDLLSSDASGPAEKTLSLRLFPELSRCSAITHRHQKGLLSVPARGIRSTDRQSGSSHTRSSDSQTSL